MSRIVVAMFEEIAQAREAIEALKDAGFSSEEINLVASDPSGAFAKYLKVSEEDIDASQDIAQGASMGAVVGGLGGLLLSLGALVIPGIGPVVAAGPILTALAGAGIGAVAGGLLGALTDLGVPKEQAGYFAEGVRRGRVLLTVRTEDDLDDRAMEVVQRFQPVDVQQHVSYWKEGMEEIQDADARPMTPSEVTEQHGSPSMVEGDYTPVEPVPVETGPVEAYDRGEGSDFMQMGAETEADRIRDGRLEDRTQEKAGQTYGSAQEMPVRPGSAETVDLGRKIDEHTNYGELNSFMDYASGFHDHYEATYTRQGYTFDSIAPAYQYGYDLALDDQHRQKPWSEIEMDARQEWERNHPDSAWDNIREAVHHAWAEVTGQE